MLNNAWLKQTRLSLGLTLQDIADKMFVTRQCISDIETGKTHKKSTMVVYEKLLIELSPKDDFQI